MTELSLGEKNNLVIMSFFKNMSPAGKNDRTGIVHEVQMLRNENKRGKCLEQGDLFPNKFDFLLLL